LQLEGVRTALANGDSEASAFARNRVFKLNQPLVRQAVRRIPASTLAATFSALSRIDRQSKGQDQGDPWQTLEQMLVGLALAGSKAGSRPGNVPGNGPGNGAGQGRAYSR
jgi:DNA polymerase III delta subunit